MLVHACLLLPSSPMMVRRASLLTGDFRRSCCPAMGLFSATNAGQLRSMPRIAVRSDVSGLAPRTTQRRRESHPTGPPRKRAVRLGQGEEPALPRWKRSHVHRVANVAIAARDDKAFRQHVGSGSSSTVEGEPSEGLE